MVPGDPQLMTTSIANVLSLSFASDRINKPDTIVRICLRLNKENGSITKCEANSSTCINELEGVAISMTTGEGRGGFQRKTLSLDPRVGTYLGNTYPFCATELSISPKTPWFLIATLRAPPPLDRI